MRCGSEAMDLVLGIRYANYVLRSSNTNHTHMVKIHNATRNSSKLLHVNIQESKETGILEERDKWMQYAAEVNITKDSVGYMKPLVTTVIVNVDFLLLSSSTCARSTNNYFF